jgi:anti-anti-sigma regulatory factor
MSVGSGPSTGPREDQDGSVAVLTSPSGVRLVLSGPVDASLSDELTAATREAAQARLPVDVDTRTVTFMDSTVIAAIAHLAHRIPHRVRFIEPPELVQFLLEVTHIGEVVDVLDHDPGFPTDPAREGRPPAA